MKNLQIYLLVHSQRISRPSAGTHANSCELVRAVLRRTLSTNALKAKNTSYFFPFSVHLCDINEAAGKKAFFNASVHPAVSGDVTALKPLTSSIKVYLLSKKCQGSAILQYLNKTSRNQNTEQRPHKVGKHSATIKADATRQAFYTGESLCFRKAW